MSFLQQEKKMGNMNERHFNMITKVGGFLFFSLGKKKFWSIKKIIFVLNWIQI